MNHAPESEPMLIDPRPRLIGGSALLSGPFAMGIAALRSVDSNAAQGRLETGLEIGATVLDLSHPDVAARQSAEENLAAVFQQKPGLRDHILIAAQGGGAPFGPARGVLTRHCEAALRRMDLDYIDLFQVRPNLLASHEETADALSQLKRDGKIREAGVAGFTPSQTRALQSFLDFPLVATCPETSLWSPGAFFDGSTDLAQEFRLTPFAMRPLAGGVFDAEALPEEATPERRHRFDATKAALDGIARRQNVSRDAVALAWLMAHPAGMIPVLEEGSEEAMRLAATALHVRLTPGDWHDVLIARMSAPEI